MINIKSMPFESKLIGQEYDRAINAKEFARYLKSFVTNGVIVSGQNLLENELKVVSAGGLNVNIGIGQIHINGRVGWRDEGLDMLTLEQGGALPRIDRIVMEMNETEDVRSIVLKVMRGTENENPLPPELIRTEEVYQVSLAQCRVNAGSAEVNSIVDERANKEVCGLANMFIGTTGYEADYVMLDNENVENYELENEVSENKNVQRALKKIKSYIDNIVSGITEVAKAALADEASQAIKLKTARKINGVNFNGEADITAPDGTKAPISHASSDTTYGVGTTANFGHCKTINNLTQASHVNGNALSAYQGKVLKDLIDDKYVFGTYTGDGTATRNIGLGFRPKAVLLFDKRGRTSASQYDYMRGGLSLDGHPTMASSTFGIQINSTGFSVAYSSSGNPAATNENSTIYHYIAFKN